MVRVRVVWNGRCGWTFLRPEGRAPVALTALLRLRNASHCPVSARRRRRHRLPAKLREQPDGSLLDTLVFGGDLGARPSLAREFRAKEWKLTSWQRVRLAIRGTVKSAQRARTLPGARLCVRSTSRSRLPAGHVADSNGCRRGFGAAAAGPRRTPPRSLGCGSAARCASRLGGSPALVGRNGYGQGEISRPVVAENFCPCFAYVGSRGVGQMVTSPPFGLELSPWP